MSRMPHRPAPEMFAKRAVIITQCLGAGAKSAAEDIKHSLSWWGISEIKVFTGKLMENIVWEKLPTKKRSELTIKMKRLSEKLANIDEKKAPRTNMITRVKFFFCRMMQKSLHENDPAYLDGKYWFEQGWLAKVTNKEYLAYAVEDKSTHTVIGSVGTSYYEDFRQIGVTYFIGAKFRGWAYLDGKYWFEQGWLAKVRPWKISA